MKIFKMAFVFLLLAAVLCGCAYTKNSPPKKSKAVKAAETTAQNASDASAQSTPGATGSAAPSNDGTGDIKNMDFSATSIINLPHVLERTAKSGKPLTAFSAKIMNVKKISDVQYTFTIDKIEVNRKNTDKAQGTEPPYFNKEVKKEEIKVPYDAVVVIENDIPMPIGDAFMAYVHNNADKEDGSAPVYNFYLCGNEVAFIQYIYIP